MILEEILLQNDAMSGGTLIALAAHEIVMSNDAVRGTVDPQLRRRCAASLRWNTCPGRTALKAWVVRKIESHFYGEMNKAKPQGDPPALRGGSQRLTSTEVKVGSPGKRPLTPTTSRTWGPLPAPAGESARRGPPSPHGRGK